MGYKDSRAQPEGGSPSINDLDVMYDYISDVEAVNMLNQSRHSGIWEIRHNELDEFTKNLIVKRQ